jgi:hypothetical protein
MYSLVMSGDGAKRQLAYAYTLKFCRGEKTYEGNVS